MLYLYYCFVLMLNCHTTNRLKKRDTKKQWWICGQMSHKKKKNCCH